MARQGGGRRKWVMLVAACGVMMFSGADGFEGGFAALAAAVVAERFVWCAVEEPYARCLRRNRGDCVGGCVRRRATRRVDALGTKQPGGAVGLLNGAVRIAQDYPWLGTGRDVWVGFI